MASLTYWHLLTRLRVSITKHRSTFLCLLYLSICSLSSLPCGLQFLINQPPAQGIATTCLNTTFSEGMRLHSCEPSASLAHLSPLYPLCSSFYSAQSHSAKTRSSLGLTMYISFTMFLFHYKNPRAYIVHSHVNFLVQSCISPVNARFDCSALTLKP